jgi:hypothetical protein
VAPKWLHHVKQLSINTHFDTPIWFTYLQSLSQYDRLEELSITAYSGGGGLSPSSLLQLLTRLRRVTIDS